MLHPILGTTAVIEAALKAVADSNPTFMSAPDKAQALAELVALQAQETELLLRVLASAGDVAESTAARDAGEWLAHATRSRPEDTRADLALAVALDRRYTVVADALRDGVANLAQAEVIVRALDGLPRDVPAEVVGLAEERLVGYTGQFGPRQLARLGRRILDVVAPEIADATEARRLAGLEEAAHRKTRLGLRRVGDGTTRITGLLPDAAATRLATYLEAFTNPRKDPEARGPVLTRAGDPLDRLPYPRRLGEAFLHLLEVVDPKRLPVHGGDATTLLITIPLESLRAELATAEVIGASHVPGDDDPCFISAAEARRLACSANLIPMVLGGDSEVLDQGRAQRLFTAAQRKALIYRDRHCRAEGCDIPGTWSEAHHWISWALGGLTDIDNGVLLCRHHHQRIHEHTHRAERLPTGDIRFHRRR